MTEDEALQTKAVEVAKQVHKRAVTEKLKEIAESHVINHCYRAGSRSYVWTEEDYRSDDLDGDVVVCGECLPSDADSYSWWEVISSEIHSSEVSDRNDESGEYCVEVEVWVAVSSGNEDEEVDETVSPDLRTIYVQIDRDEDGDFYVFGTEE
ncbi:hypothetical protein IQ244_20180 [Nostoc sp. LEGE 06077]|uniref:hypothetical protein n=1 Tax=Nostoc sp. LEGE 06077 TaxID=915325 RepID=UPI00187F8C0C|nr:hypothetical protein [Nostoc sp. LEGE 06077]MBE9208817.1 hypothetical protein [Nostoc sp. LEGE 06077]